MIPNDIKKDIENGIIISRRQLYSRMGGRSRKLLKYLDDNNILIPHRWTSEQVLLEIRSLKANGKSLLANDNWNLCRAAKQFFGTWNAAMTIAIGECNQRRYTDISDSDLLSYIRQFILINGRIPLREEFDGKDSFTPYWEVYLQRFGCSSWRDILSLIDLGDLSITNTSKHGRGYICHYNGYVFLSQKEMLIGKYLFDKGIPFLQEVGYKNSNHRFDFYVPSFDTYIEYYGLTTEEYLARIEDKRRLYNNRCVLEIFKYDDIEQKLDSVFNIAQ